jgi:hypothetical protein
MHFSNKTLAVLLVVATSVSLFGTIATIGRLEGHSPFATGRASTDTGLANFSINSTISIVFTVNVVDFGSGNVNGSGAHNCTLNTSTALNAADCIGFNSNVPPLRIQNQGNGNVSLNISFNQSAAQFIGGTNPGLTFVASVNETGACGSAYLNTAMTAVNTSINHSICNSTGFNWITGNRTLNIDLGLRIPQDAPTGVRWLGITAYASSP